MTNRLAALLLSFVTLGSAIAPAGARDRETFYQTSTLDALMKGLYDGAVPFSELRRHGDFALGTLNALDGEMVGLDGRFYQVRSDGRVSLIKGDALTPFAVATYFDADLTLDLNGPMEYPEVEKALDRALPSKNLFYAVRIDGVFGAIKTRSVPRQVRPYPPLLEVTKTQPTFEYRNVKGTLVGFRCPEYARGFNLPGYHFHFLSEDRKKGGHLLSVTLQSAKARVDVTPGFHLALPTDREFMGVDLTPVSPGELEAAEKDRK
jgi:acetolactate decarboxylase